MAESARVRRFLSALLVVGSVPGYSERDPRGIRERALGAQEQKLMDDVGRRPLKVGLVLPHIEEWMGGDTARWSDLVAMARRAEALGFDSLWLVDHFWYRFPLDDGRQRLRQAAGSPLPQATRAWTARG